MNDFLNEEDFDLENETFAEEPKVETPNAEPVYTPPYYTPPKKEKKKGWTGGKVVALALCCAIIGGIMGVAGTFVGGVIQKNLPMGNTTNIYVGNRGDVNLETVPVDTEKLMTASQVYAANVNSTVGITTSIVTNYWGFQTTSPASGSGFVITKDGYIVTNYHVVEDSNSITVSLYDGASYEAKLVGYDAAIDLAVIKVDAENLTPVVLGDSDNLHVGDDVVAIGNPLGELTFSLTFGKVSALDREVTFSGNITMDLIQTDAAINSGNSGGALFNLYGEVIGITNAKYSGSSNSGATIDNIGFAIPINDVKSAVTSIIENGFVVKPYIGISVSDIAEEMQGYGLPKGAAVESVAQDSPAEDAGLQEKDIITQVNEVQISSSNELVDLVKAAKAGDILKMKVYRQGAVLELTVTVGEQTQSANTQSEQTPQTNQQQQQQQQQQMPDWDGIWDSFPFGGFFG